MKKTIYLARKLKAFSFDDIFLLAEISRYELQKILDKLVEKKYLKNNKQSYIFNECINEEKEETKLPKSGSSYSLVETELIKKIRNLNAATDFNPEEEQVWKTAPQFNKKKAEKFLYLLELTKGLNGQKLKNFISEYNKNNPDNKTSYGNLIKRRRAYILQDKIGLLTKYGKSKNAHRTDEKHYELFKELYLNKLGLSFEKCREEISKYFNEELSTLPSAMTFRRYLKQEFTKIEIQKKRGM